MSYSAVETIEKGFKRFTNRNALILLGVFIGLSSIFGMIAYSFPDFAAALAVVAIPFLLVLPIVTIRTFFSDETDHIPESAYTDDVWIRVAKALGYYILLILASLPALVAFAFGGVLSILGGPLGILVGILVGIVLAILTVYVWLGLVLVIYVISLEDKGIIDSVKYSWELAEGNRIYLLLISVLISILVTLLGVITLPISFFSEFIADVISVMLQSFGSVLSLSALTYAYKNIVAGAAEGGE